MKETKFIEQNKEKWKEFEQILKSSKRDPDQLSRLFVQITDDLSYARTFYPFRSVRIYLNNTAQKVFYSIYKNKKERKHRFIQFWREELPIIVYQCRKELILSFVIFALSVAIGILSSVNDPDFSKTILGESYVEMTVENIKGGDPMAVYKKMNEVDMLLGITVNNVLVAFRTFILGVFFAIGTVAIMVYNGIMVGTFQYFFIERDLFMESFLTIWIHGTLEISSIIIAGGSGLVLGKGLLFPGTYSRLQSFQVSALRGLKLLIGVVPILVFAAILESFVTRYTDVPDILRASIILLSAFFIALYFIWYPIRKARNSQDISMRDVQLAPQRSNVLQVKDKIKSSHEIFRDVITFYKKYFTRLLKINIISALIYVPLAVYVLSDHLKGDPTYQQWMFGKISTFFSYDELPILYLLNTILVTVNVFFIFTFLHKETSDSDTSKNRFGRNLIIFLKCLAFMACVNTLFFLPDALAIITLLLSLPIIALSIFISIHDKRNIFTAFGQSFQLLSGNYGRMIQLFLTLAFLTFTFFFFMNSPFLLFYIEILKWNLPFEPQQMESIFIIVSVFISIVAMNIALPLLFSGKGLLFFSLKEIKEANGLKERIRNFGTISKSY
ncbi:stage II sporulation protein M [Splendidivirga corallicola]|uniref:stage II sporulation protein M n=1 Tax=Splendidivirga corallicola TaxID=3051826 RepID=UPI00321197B4